MNKNNYEIPDKIHASESDYLYLKISQISGAGKGLFTAIPIYKNEIIAVFKGEILTDAEAALRASQKMDGYFINMPDGTIMDSKDTECFAKYANDTEGIGITKYTNNAQIALDIDEQVCIIALRNIKAGDEIFCSYGKKYWKNFLSSH
jgi:SET domain-containing protein